MGRMKNKEIRGWREEEETMREGMVVLKTRKHRKIGMMGKERRGKLEEETTEEKKRKRDEPKRFKNRWKIMLIKKTGKEKHWMEEELCGKTVKKEKKGERSKERSNEKTKK